MARHVVTETRDARGRIVPLVALLVAVVMAVVVTLTSNPRTLLARAPLIGDDCPSPRLPTTRIDVAVAPDIASTVEEILDPLRTKELSDGRCLQVDLTVQQPAETVAGAQILPLDRAPHLWIPDSSLWLPRLQQWKPQRIGAFASSPVVVATSRDAVETLKWDDNPPTWDEAMAGSRAVAAPNIAQDAAGLSAAIALWQALGKGERAQQGLAAAVLAGLRADAPTREAAITAAQSGTKTAPLIPVSEQGVWLANRGVRDAQLVAVYPDGGSPSLDYPLVRIDAATSLTTERRTAVQAVADALASPAARSTVRAGGFRDTTGATSMDSDAVPASVDPLRPPAVAEIRAVLTRVISLSAPSRFLTVVDLSGSMRAPAGNGMDRITLAAASANAAGQFLPDVAQVGLWGFSQNLKGKRDWIEIYDVEELGAKKGSGSHRDAINRGLFSLPKQLGGDGTTLYATAIEAMKKMTSLYDPRAGNAVVLFTDGTNDADGGPSLEETVAELKSLYNPERPVRLVCIGLGDGADMPALKAMAEAAGGTAYAAKEPSVLPKVLFETMTRRDG